MSGPTNQRAAYAASMTARDGQSKNHHFPGNGTLLSKRKRRSASRRSCKSDKIPENKENWIQDSEEKRFRIRYPSPTVSMQERAWIPRGSEESKSSGKMPIAESQIAGVRDFSRHSDAKNKIQEKQKICGKIVACKRKIKKEVKKAKRHMRQFSAKEACFPAKGCAISKQCQSFVLSWIF